MGSGRPCPGRRSSRHYERRSSHRKMVEYYTGGQSMSTPETRRSLAWGSAARLPPARPNAGRSNLPDPCDDMQSMRTVGSGSKVLSQFRPSVVTIPSSSDYATTRRDTNRADQQCAWETITPLLGGIKRARFTASSLKFAFGGGDVGVGKMDAAWLR